MCPAHQSSGMTTSSELALDRLLDHVGVSAARIEQGGAMGEPHLLGVQLGELDLPLGLLAAIVAPAQNAVGAHDRIAEEIGDDEDGEGGQGRSLDRLERVPPHRLHDVTDRISKSAWNQAFCADE